MQERIDVGSMVQEEHIYGCVGVGWHQPHRGIGFDGGVAL